MRAPQVASSQGQAQAHSAAEEEADEQRSSPSPAQAGTVGRPEARKARLQPETPARLEQKAEDNVTREVTQVTAGVDFGELETQLREESDKVDELALDRGSQDDTSVGDVASQGDASAPKVDSSLGGTSSDGSSTSPSAILDLSDFLSQLPKV